MKSLEWKNYQAKFKDENGNDKKITFSSNAYNDEQIEISALSQILKKTGTKQNDVNDLEINEIEVW